MYRARSSRRRGKGLLFISLWAGIVLLALGVAAGVFLFGGGQDAPETRIDRPAPDPLLPVSLDSPFFPGLEESDGRRLPGASVASPDGSVVVMLPGSMAVAMPLLEFRDLPAGALGELPPGRSPPIRAFYIALHNPHGMPGQSPPAEYATLQVRLTERDYDAAGGDPFRLTIRRYDEAAQAWEEPYAALDLPWLRVHVTTDALGLFAIAVMTDVADNIQAPPPRLFRAGNSSSDDTAASRVSAGSRVVSNAHSYAPAGGYANANPGAGAYADRRPRPNAYAHPYAYRYPSCWA